MELFGQVGFLTHVFIKKECTELDNLRIKDNKSINITKNATNKASGKSQTFTFNSTSVINEDDNDNNVYERCTLPMSELTLLGYNSSLFMVSSDRNKEEDVFKDKSLNSIFYNYFSSLFDALNNNNRIQKYQLKIKIFECFGEKITDLLAKHGKTKQNATNNKKLSNTINIQSSVNGGGVSIRGMNEIEILDVDNAMKILGICLKHRTTLYMTSSTSNHSCSVSGLGSVGHVFIEVVLEQEIKLESGDLQQSTSKALFTDFAHGSTLSFQPKKNFETDESIFFCSKIQIDEVQRNLPNNADQILGGSIKDSQEIWMNMLQTATRGITTLLRIIRMQGEKKNGHIPYRDSHFTRILKPTLSGNVIPFAIAIMGDPYEASSTNEWLSGTINALRFLSELQVLKNYVWSSSHIVCKQSSRSVTRTQNRSIVKSKLPLLETSRDTTAGHETEIDDPFQEGSQSRPSSSAGINNANNSDAMDTDYSLMHQFHGLNVHLQDNLGLLAAFIDETQARMKNIFGVIQIRDVTMEEVTAAGINAVSILEDMVSTPSKNEKEKNLMELSENEISQLNDKSTTTRNDSVKVHPKVIYDTLKDDLSLVELSLSNTRSKRVESPNSAFSTTAVPGNVVFPPITGRRIEKDVNDSDRIFNTPKQSTYAASDIVRDSTEGEDVLSGSMESLDIDRIKDKEDKDLKTLDPIFKDRNNVKAENNQFNEEESNGVASSSRAENYKNPLFASPVEYEDPWKIKRKRHDPRKSISLEDEDDAAGDDLSKDEKKYLRAVSQSNYAVVENLLRMKLVNVSTQNSFQRDGMQIAARNGDTKMLETLHRFGGRINSRGPKGDTLLHLASYNSHLFAMKWLISFGAVPQAVDLRGQTVVHVACRRANHQILPYLFEVLALDFEVEDFEGQTPYQLVPRVASDEDSIKTRSFFEKIGIHS